MGYPLGAPLALYIRNQEAHHRKMMTFDQKFILLLEKHRVAYDSRYVLG